MIFNRAGFTIVFHDDEVDTSQFRDQSLEEWLGLMLHGAQQGVNSVYFRGYLVEATRMEDTLGEPVKKDTILRISTTMPYEVMDSVIEDNPRG